MNKPQMKQTEMIVSADASIRMIMLYASPDTLLELADFGNVLAPPRPTDTAWLCVDERFDFAEVLAYVQYLISPSNPVDSVWTED